ncbi:hypothetical protein [Hymenobacter algoricola]|uniref:Uncharacterized protein n=1 Tax=Hymenobacter algoricola TaxID=486267 RepID=A0ABP7NNH0_9BACT
MNSDKIAAEAQALTTVGIAAQLAAGAAAAATKARKRDRLEEILVSSAASTATRLLPLMELIERIRPHTANDSVFSSRREKINAQLTIVCEQLKAEKPKRQAIADAFKTMGEFVVEESREVSRDEVKESAKRFVLATIRHAPGLINAAHQARLLS